MSLGEGMGMGLRGRRHGGAWAMRTALVALMMLGAICAGPASAAQVSSISPSGEVPEVRQVLVRFSEAVVAAGDPRAPAPFMLSCNGRPVAGDARWLGATQWAFDLREALPAGSRCSLKRLEGWRPLQGSLDGPAEHSFSTGAPTVVQTRPWAGAAIEEDQHFLLQLSGAIERASLAGHAWCEIEGLGDRVPLVVLPEAQRDAVLRAQRLPVGVPAARWLLVRCDRALPAEAGVRLVWGEGIAAAAQPGQPPLVTRVARPFSWKVRPRFSAEFSCERERANAPCLPLKPLSLRFSAPVPRELALAVRLQLPAAAPGAASRALPPQIDPNQAQDRAASLSELRFAPPLPENARLLITLPPALRDESGRALSNAGAFPLTVQTGGMPPLAKFAAAPFGIVEASNRPDSELPPMLPMTLRHVQADLQGASGSGRIALKRLDAATPDEQLLRWFVRLQRWHESELSARELGRPKAEWTVVEQEPGEDGRMREVRRERRIATRELSLLDAEPGVQRQDLPTLSGREPKATELIGLPLPQTGFHLIEVSSRILGTALLSNPAPMYVRSGALVTNLAVHFKMGRSSSLAWVTALDRGRPVAGATVTVNDCRGRALWSGSTDAEGLARIERGWDEGDREVSGSDCLSTQGLFVTARTAAAPGQAPSDLSFVFSGWTKGIEPWRFNLPVGGGRGRAGKLVAHSVLDRNLLRAGDTLAMKHFVRSETATGLARVGAADLPGGLVLRHLGSGQELRQSLSWRDAGRSAESRWEIPKTAKLGLYEISLVGTVEGRAIALPAGQFRVEEFRVPLTQAQLVAPKGTQVAPASLRFAARLGMSAGGPLPRVPLKLSALLKERDPAFAELKGLGGFSFTAPRARSQGSAEDEAADGGENAGRLVADRLTATTDAQGTASFSLDQLPALARPSELTAEMSFADPNGETQTVAQRLRLWPAAVVVGIRTRNWAASRGQLRWDVVVLDTAGTPLAQRKVQVSARQVQVTSTRQRIVGGFYAYDNRSSLRELGTLCSGSTDAQGRLSCEASVEAQGEIELVARAADDAGRESLAAASVWAVGEEEQWFEQENDDRIDVLAERREVQPGETVRLQVRMPFREATALVSVEREGVLSTQVRTLRGREPVVEVQVPALAPDGAGARPSWSPNVYVSVLVLRGRLRDVPWTSFFRWGWREPLEWWRAFRYEGRDWRAPTALVDLAKPAFRLGVAELQVGLQPHRLDVAVTPERSSYGVRETVKTLVRVTQQGRPVAGAQIAFAAVDEGLLALRENTSWRLLEGLMRPRPWSVQTATAQGEVIGRRHYGRKALPPGGDGGANPTRELFDTLLLWRDTVQLDAKGEARIEVPLNDALTSFRLVAVADAGDERFGSGSATVRVTQDLQIFSGLPPLAREGDRLEALLTVRNTSARAMALRVRLQAQPMVLAEAGAAAAGALPAMSLPEQRLELPAGAALPVRWSVTLPQGADRVQWQAQAEELAAGGAIGASGSSSTSSSNNSSGTRARDSLSVGMALRPAVPLRVWQASLLQLDGPLSLPFVPPAGALAAAGSGASAARLGGLDVALRPSLAGNLPGLRRFFQTYPYSCIEQRSSKALALRDTAAWAALGAELPAHLDADGLASYFPVREGDAARGSDKLTAYLVAAAHEAGWAWPAVELERMLTGLAAFVEGRTLRRFASPREDLDVRKLAALEALSRHGRATPRMLGSLAITPQQWPTAALLDWWGLLRRLPGLAEREARLAEVQSLLRARLVAGGTTLRFANEDEDRWWWLMDSPDANAARLLLAAVDQPGWQDELPRLVSGHLGRQQLGAWSTTVANQWSVRALERFSARFEAQPASGRTQFSFGGSTRSIELPPAPAASGAGAPVRLPWPEGGAAQPLRVQHQGSGKPWLSVQTLAAVPLREPLAAGYRLQRSVNVVERARPDRLSVGDVLRVRLQIDALAPMAWVVVQDPLPAGASVLGGGLGRDSSLATRGETASSSLWVAYEERAQEAWRAYLGWMPKGQHVLEYTLRLNSAGRLQLPPSRVEAMYAPESFAETPNEALEVLP